MFIYEIKVNKKRYLELLLLADESEEMVNKYLERGIMHVLNDNGIKTICIVTDEGSDILEIKNIVTVPEYQNHGYGKKMITFIESAYKNDFKILQVGTGDSPLTVPFYEKCGFKKSHKIENFLLIIIKSQYMNVVYKLLT